MFEREGQGTLFLEAAVRLDARPHCRIDAIPVPIGVDQEASMYFKEVCTRTHNQPTNRTNTLASISTL
jgi:hypothetical protein